MVKPNQEEKLKRRQDLVDAQKGYRKGVRQGYRNRRSRRSTERFESKAGRQGVTGVSQLLVDPQLPILSTAKEVPELGVLFPTLGKERNRGLNTAYTAGFAILMNSRRLSFDAKGVVSGVSDSVPFTNFVTSLTSETAAASVTGAETSLLLKAIDLLASQKNLKDWDPVQRWYAALTMGSSMKIYAVLKDQSIKQSFGKRYIIVNGSDGSAWWSFDGFKQILEALPNYKIPYWNGLNRLIDEVYDPWVITPEYSQIPLPSTYYIPCNEDIEAEDATEDIMMWIAWNSTKSPQGLLHLAKIGLEPDGYMTPTMFVPKLRPAVGPAWDFARMRDTWKAKSSAGAAVSLKPTGIFSAGTPSPRVVWKGDKPYDLYAFLSFLDDYVVTNNIYGLFETTAAGGSNNYTSGQRCSILNTKDDGTIGFEELHANITTIFEPTYWLAHLDISGGSSGFTSGVLTEGGGIAALFSDEYFWKNMGTGYTAAVWLEAFGFPGLVELLKSKGGALSGVSSNRKTRRPGKDNENADRS